jgi:hypothetical protein
MDLWSSGNRGYFNPGKEHNEIVSVNVGRHRIESKIFFIFLQNAKTLFSALQN